MVDVRNIIVRAFIVCVPLLDGRLVVQEHEPVPLEELSGRGILCLNLSGVENLHGRIRFVIPCIQMFFIHLEEIRKVDITIFWMEWHPYLQLLIRLKLEVKFNVARHF